VLLYSITYSTISYDEDVHGGDYDDDDNNVNDHNDIHMFIYIFFCFLAYSCQKLRVTTTNYCG